MKFIYMYGNVDQVLPLIMGKFTVEETLTADSLETAAQFKNEFKLLIVEDPMFDKRNVERILSGCGYETVICFTDTDAPV